VSISDINIINKIMFLVIANHCTGESMDHGLKFTGKFKSRYVLRALLISTSIKKNSIIKEFAISEAIYQASLVLSSRITARGAISRIIWGVNT